MQRARQTLVQPSLSQAQAPLAQSPQLRQLQRCVQPARTCSTILEAGAPTRPTWRLTSSPARNPCIHSSHKYAPRCWGRSFVFRHADGASARALLRSTRLRDSGTESESVGQNGTCWRPRSSVMLLDSGPRWAVVGIPACRFRSSSRLLDSGARTLPAFDDGAVPCPPRCCCCIN